ncbi:MAG: repeat protein [Acidobacteriales bacterium]|nr:repeat protein [Terriglobales bacterium]
MTRIGAGFLAVLFCCTFSLSQSLPHHGISDEMSSFTVHVSTGNGTPAGNARVELRDIGTGQLAASGYTNSSGSLELSGLSGTVYILEITHGLSELKEKTDIRMDRILSVSLPGAGSENADVGTNNSVSVAQYKVPSKARNEYKKASESLSKQKKDEAAEHLAKALAIYPNFAEALTMRAILSMDHQDDQSALTDLESAIKIDPSYAFAYFAMGATYNSLSRFDDAVRTLERGLAIAPTSWQGYFELGKAKLGKGESEQALRQLDKAQSLVSQSYPSLHLVKAHALLSLKQYADAMNELQLFLTQAPNDSRSASARNTLEEVKAYVGR